VNLLVRYTARDMGKITIRHLRDKNVADLVARVIQRINSIITSKHTKNLHSLHRTGYASINQLKQVVQPATI
jgi:hypothetical protein